MIDSFPPFETIAIEQSENHILKLTLNRPSAANARNGKMARELLAFWESVAVAPASLRCIVLTGAGDRFFCAGGDLKERNTQSDQEWHDNHRTIEISRDLQLACPVPVIAAVNGFAFGGGCEMALACDFIYASRTATFALPEVRRGFMPGCGGTQLLARAVGERRAKELLMTGDSFAADAAYAWGLVNAIVEPEALMERAFETARLIAANAPLAVRSIKAVVHSGIETSLEVGLGLEKSAYDLLIPTSDRREGVLAFNEKRRPIFTGN